MPFIKLNYENNKQFIYYLNNQTKFIDHDKNTVLFKKIENFRVNNKFKEISYQVVNYITIGFDEFYIINEDNIKNKAQKKGINLDNFYNELKSNYPFNLEIGNKKVTFNINDKKEKNKKNKKLSLNLENGKKKLTFNINNNKKNKKLSLNLENEKKKLRLT